jgi:hypothetical protein
MGTLFATTVANAKPQDKDYKLSDVRGLYLLVRPGGTKLWRLNYRYLENTAPLPSVPGRSQPDRRTRPKGRGAPADRCRHRSLPPAEMGREHG